MPPRRTPSATAFLWPYADSSIWNMPIGSEAGLPGGRTPARRRGVGVECRARARDPPRPSPPATSSPSAAASVAAGGRCSKQDFDLGFDLRVPDDWLVPDAGRDNPYGLTPNSSFALVTEDGLRSIQGQVIARCEVGGPVYLPDWMRFSGNRKESSLRGDGLDIGTAGHGASGLSTLGGTVRLGELVGDRPIRHSHQGSIPSAIRCCTTRRTCAGIGGRRDGPTATPARRRLAPIGYNREGERQAGDRGAAGAPRPRPPSSPSASPPPPRPGESSFYAMQNYGVYFVEDAAHDVWDLVAERDVEIEFEEAYGYGLGSRTWRAEMNRLMTALSVITNNAPWSVGGGGTPRVALAPPFADVALPTYNVFRLRPLADTSLAVTLRDAGPDGRYGQGNSHDLRLAPNHPDSTLQLWEISADADGNRVRLRAVGITRNRVCVDVDNSDTDGVTNVHTWACGEPEADNRLFELVAADTGATDRFHLLPSHAKINGYANELRLTMTGDNLESAPADDALAQTFVLEPVGENDVLGRLISSLPKSVLPEAAWELFPNPAPGGQLTVRVALPERDARLQVYSVTGREVHAQPFGGLEGRLEVRLAPGTYLVRLEASSRSYPVQRVVVR